jgi:hypothetical protein
MTNSTFYPWTAWSSESSTLFIWDRSVLGKEALVDDRQDGRFSLFQREEGVRWTRVPCDTIVVRAVALAALSSGQMDGAPQDRSLTPN